MKYFVITLSLLIVLSSVALYGQSNAGSISVQNGKEAVETSEAAAVETAEGEDAPAPAGFFTMTAGSSETVGRVCIAATWPLPESVDETVDPQDEEVQETVLPKEYALGQNYPNPFNPTTVIQIALPENSIVTMKVYDILGQEVATLLGGQPMDAGVQGVRFDAAGLPSGAYFYRMTADGESGKNFSAIKKLMLIR